MTKASFILIGAGGHAAVCWDICQRLQLDVIALASPAAPSFVANQSLPLIEDDATVAEVAKQHHAVQLIHGVGSLPQQSKRRQLYQYFVQQGLMFAQLIDPSAVVSPAAQLGAGVQLFPRSVVNNGAVIEQNVIINTGAIIEHGVHIEEHAHIAPGACLSGDVRVGANTHIGSGAVITQGVTIGENAVIAAGAMVNRDVPAGHIVYAPKMVTRALKESS